MAKSEAETTYEATHSDSTEHAPARQGRKAKVALCNWPPTSRSIFWKLGRWIGKYHVVLFIQEYAEAGLWLYVNSDSRGTLIEIVLESEIPCILEDLDVVLVKDTVAPIQSQVDYPFFELFSCVNYVKRVLFIRDWRVITPLQLIRRIDNG